MTNNCKIVTLLFIISIVINTCSNPTESKNQELYVWPSQIEFTKSTHTQIIQIRNNKEGELSWEITSMPNWLTASQTEGTITTDIKEVTLTANLNQNQGEYSGTINIESNGGNIEILVSLKITIWIKNSSMPKSRVAFGTGVADNKIYAIGGYDGVDYLNIVEEYDPVTNTWTTKSPMRQSRSHIHCCAVNNKIYAMGGYFLLRPTYDTVEEYDPVTNTWTTKSPMPTKRWGHSIVDLNGLIYVIGGANGYPIEQMVNTVEIYNPATDTWSVGNSNLPTSRWMASCSVVNGKIYFIGGYKFGDTVTSTVEEYDPGTDTWATKSSMPTARGGISSGVVEGKIYIVGGGNNYPPTIAYNTVEEYDPGTDTWVTKTPMPDGRIACSAGALNGKVYVIGGRGPGQASPEIIYGDFYEYEAGIDY